MIRWIVNVTPKYSSRDEAAAVSNLSRHGRAA